MVKWRDYIRNLGPAAPPTQQGINALGFPLVSDFGTAAFKDVGTGAEDVAAGNDARFLPNNVQILATREDIEGASFHAGMNSLQTRGYYSEGDGGAAQYTRVASEPAHALKVRCADRFLPDGSTDEANGGWFVNSSTEFTPEMAGAVAFGSVNPIPGDNEQRLSNWLLAANYEGVRAVGSPGRFDVSTQIVVDLAIAGKNLTVEAPTEFILASTAALEVPIIRFTDLSGIHRYGFSWNGGTFNNSLGVWEDNAQTNTSIDITRLKGVRLNKINFKGGNDVLEGLMTSDAGVTPTNVLDLIISECLFDGVQSGVYSTGTGGTDSGGRHTVTKCGFRNVQRCMQAKADVDEVIFAENISELVSGDVFSLIEVADDMPATRVLLKGNFAHKVGRFANLRGPGKGTIVSGNTVRDFGRDLETGAQLESPHAFRMLGLSDAIVCANFIGQDEYAPLAADIGVFISAYTFPAAPAPGPYAAERNHVFNNTIENVDIGIAEGSSTPRGINYYSLNVMIGVTTPYSNLAGSGSPYFAALDSGFTVGKTSVSSISSAGIGLGKDGLLNATRSGGLVAQLNRLNDHGAIQTWYQAGVAMATLQSAANIDGFLDGGLRGKNKTLAQLGSASTWPRMFMYTSDGHAGSPGWVWSDGTNWIRVANGPVASTS